MVLSDFARELNDRDSLAFFATVEGTRGVAPILEPVSYTHLCGMKEAVCSRLP